MKILIDLTSLADNFSGIERFAMSVTEELIKDKTNQFILVFKNEIHKAFSNKQEHVTCVVLKGKNKLIFNQIILPFFLCRQNADRYLFPAFPEPFLFVKKNRFSAIHDVGCWDCPESNKKYMTLYFKVLYRKVAMGKSHIVTVSRFSKERIKDILGVKEERISVVYNGLAKHLLEDETKDARQVQQKYKLPETYILCLATLEPRKNLKLLISAYVDLFMEGKVSQELVLAGRKGWLVDNLLADVDAEVVKHIHFTGFIDEEDLAQVYRGATVFVFPSLYEGFGVPPIEAMCVGTPVISSDASSLPEVLGKAAVYFRSGDKEELKSSLQYVEDLGPEEREKMIQEGKKHARYYTWEKSGETLRDVLLDKGAEKL